MFEIYDCLLDVCPRGVLRQHGADGYFERRIARPPMREPEVIMETIIYLLKLGFHFGTKT